MPVPVTPLHCTVLTCILPTFITRALREKVLQQGVEGGEVVDDKTYKGMTGYIDYRQVSLGRTWCRRFVLGCTMDMHPHSR